jgi:Fe2+ transport system protein B
MLWWTENCEIQLLCYIVYCYMSCALHLPLYLAITITFEHKEYSVLDIIYKFFAFFTFCFIYCMGVKLGL